MTLFSAVHHVDEAGLALILAPRDDVLVGEEPAGDELASAHAEAEFVLASGPFDRYSRVVEITQTNPSDNTFTVTETYDYAIAAPFWKLLLMIPMRRALTRRPIENKAPWWAPPDRFDASVARTVSLLCVAAIVTGYLGAVIGQVATYATDEFGSSDREQGILLAAVRVGVVITVVVTTMADRRGRKRLLIASMLTGCAFTVLGAASTGLVTLGMSQSAARGFATAITLLIGIMAAEVAPRSSRAYIVGILTLTAGLGAGIPVWFLFVADLHIRAWRVLFLFGALFVPVALWIGRRLDETPRFSSHLAASEAGEVDEKGSMTRSRLILIATVAFLILMFAAPATQFRNDFLRDDRGFNGGMVTLFVLAANTPQGIGVAIAAKVADRKGRKPVAAVTVGVGAVCTVATYVFSGAAMWFAAIAAGIIAAGAVPALGVYSAEMFGTGRRGRANGLISIAGVTGSATGLIAVGEMSDRFGEYGPAFAIMAFAPLLVVALPVLAFYPESAHRELEHFNPQDRR